ncbi:MAG: cytochrome b [Pararhodobacter sp.]
MPYRYHPLLVALHWLIALFILGLLAAGTFVLVPLPNSAPEKMISFRMHMALGVTVLFLMVLRLAVRLTTRQPPPAETGHPLTKRLARATHWTLYALVIAMASSGLALSVASGLPDAVFGNGPMPADFSDYTARQVHGLIARALMVLITLHVIAALWHQFIRDDGLFARIWFGQR